MTLYLEEKPCEVLAASPCHEHAVYFRSIYDALKASNVIFFSGFGFWLSLDERQSLIASAAVILEDATRLLQLMLSEH